MEKEEVRMEIIVEQSSRCLGTENRIGNFGKRKGRGQKDKASSLYFTATNRHSSPACSLAHFAHNAISKAGIDANFVAFQTLISEFGSTS